MQTTDFKTLIPSVLLLTVLCGLACCAPQKAVFNGQNQEVSLLGDFEDDYGIRYSISAQEWHQHPNAKYRIVKWRADAQYLIAQNDEANPSDAGLWTRIDWIELPDMLPYEWAFCLSVYDAPTALEAEKASTAQRDNPRTGCNGYPFSRMKRHSTENMQSQ